jgi:hypothetical protein
MAKSGCVFCSRITDVGLPAAKAAVNRRVASADPPQAMTSRAIHCELLNPLKNLHPSATAGTE